MTLGRLVTALLTNKSGGDLVRGSAVVVDATNDSAFTTSTSSADRSVIGVLVEDVANDALGRVGVDGVVTAINKGAVTRGHYVVQSTTAGACADSGTAATSAPPAGAFGIALTGAGGDGTIELLLIRTR